MFRLPFIKVTETITLADRPRIYWTMVSVDSRPIPKYRWTWGIKWRNDCVDHGRRDGSDAAFEFRLQMPDRSVKYLRMIGHATRDELGQLEFTGAMQDLTTQRCSEYALSKLRSELALVARVMSLGALTASITHEVNQPLSGIMTNASTCMRMLNSNPPDVDGARETARRTLRDGQRASDVIKRVRALFGKKSVSTELVDLNEATREVLTLSRNELQRSRVMLRLEFADDLPAVAGDRVQLQQVILNLLLNAAQAMSGIDDRPRQLVIRSEREEEKRVRLSVRDVGVGFDAKDANRLFEAFYTTKSGGMGIGLSVSRSIIESHHGRLWAAPNNGPGATFSFSIPCGRDGIKYSGGLDPIERSTRTSGEQIERNS
jgi:signal transduction histidine kinase